MTQTRFYPHARVRGFAPWSPQKKTRVQLERVQEVLDEYRAHLPLTIRQIFYRLVGRHGYSKTENAYARLCETLNRARRAGIIDFDDIRDDGVTVDEPSGFSGKAGFWRTVEHAAKGYTLDRLADQPVFVEIWVEAGGMVPQVARVAREYGIPVFSSGGFNSTTAKRDTALRVDERDRETVILHAGDHDPSGLSVFDSLAEDVEEMVFGLSGEGTVSFERVVVTEDQIRAYGLPTAPPKKNDRRGNWQGGTVQAEALPPDVLADEIRSAILRHIDHDVWLETVRREKQERGELVEQIRNLAL